MVYVNGSLAGQWATGYTGFTVALDDHPALRRRQRDPGRLPARTRTPAGTPAPASTGRCTSSSGRSPTSRSTASGVTTQDVDGELAVVEVATTVEHDGRGLATLDLVTELRDGDGAVVATGDVAGDRPAGRAGRRPAAVLLSGPRPVEPGLAGAVHGVGLAAGRGDRGRRRRRLASASAPCRSTPSAACGSTASRSCCAAPASTPTTACSARPTIDRAEERRVQLLKAAGLQRDAQRAQPDEPGDARRLRPATASSSWTS